LQLLSLVVDVVIIMNKLLCKMLLIYNLPTG
jgi:hypothetical protein